MNKRTNSQSAQSDDKETVSIKSPKRALSSTPSESANNKHGYEVASSRLRSVLCHPLGLSLMHALNDGDPSTLKCLAKEQRSIDFTESLNNILSNSVEQWRQGRKLEEKLTKAIAEKTEELSGRLHYSALSEVQLRCKDNVAQSNARMDIVFKASGISTPYAIIEFGLAGMEWSKKLDQCVKYIDRLVEGGMNRGKEHGILEFKRPILCTVVTIEDMTIEDKNNGVFDFKIGVFLCSRRDADNTNDSYRMSLLWNDRATSLQNASNLFGRLLRVTHDFKFWIDDIEKFVEDNKYMYLSSSCCKCTMHHDRDDDDGTSSNTEDPVVVLRSYDNRVRKSDRNPEIYLDAKCQKSEVEEGVGVGETHIIVDLIGGEDIDRLEASSMKKDDPLDEVLWEQMGKRSLKIISTPYRLGKHCTNTPKAFVPIIRQLQRLHATGYVHGDIRAFNAVFGNTPDDGWLIDFDYGGRLNEAHYPKGYNNSLADGSRIGVAEKKIQKIDDWFALGNLIFRVHMIDIKHENDAVTVLNLTDHWSDLESPPTNDEIEQLVGFLQKTEHALKLNRTFSAIIKTNENGEKMMKTMEGATGTPPRNNT